MISASDWVIIDTFILLLQILVAGVMVINIWRHIHDPNVIIFKFLFCIFSLSVAFWIIFPAGVGVWAGELMQTDVVWIRRQISVVGGIPIPSLIDALALFISVCVLCASTGQHTKKKITWSPLIFIIIFGIIICIGLLSRVDSSPSVYQAANETYNKYSIVRHLVTFIVGPIFSFIYLNKFRVEYLIGRERCLFIVLKAVIIITLLSSISVCALPDVLKNDRYGSFSTFGSQSALQLFAISVGLMFIYGFSRSGIGPYVIALSGLALLGLYKVLIYYFGVAAATIFGNKILGQRLCSSRPILIAFLFLLLLVEPLTILLANQLNLLGESGSLYTRALQAQFATEALDTPIRFLFGLGWDVPYAEIQAFGQFDGGAWDSREVATGWARAVQIVPFSLLRSVGIVGLTMMTIMAALFVCESIRANLMNKRRLNWRTNVGLILIFVTYLSVLFSGTDVLPESVSLVSGLTWLFFMTHVGGSSSSSLGCLQKGNR